MTVGSTAALGDGLSLWWIIPFAAIVLAIAVLPMVVPAWYGRERHKALVAALLGVPVVLYLLFGRGAAGREQVLSSVEEYLSFIILKGTFIAIRPLNTWGTNTRSGPSGP